MQRSDLKQRVSPCMVCLDRETTVRSAVAPATPWAAILPAQSPGKPSVVTSNHDGEKSAVHCHLSLPSGPQAASTASAHTVLSLELSSSGCAKGTRGCRRLEAATNFFIEPRLTAAWNSQTKFRCPVRVSMSTSVRVRMVVESLGVCLVPRWVERPCLRWIRNGERHPSRCAPPSACPAPLRLDSKGHATLTRSGREAVWAPDGH